DRGAPFGCSLITPKAFTGLTIDAYQSAGKKLDVLPDSAEFGLDHGRIRGVIAFRQRAPPNHRAGFLVQFDHGGLPATGRSHYAIVIHVGRFGIGPFSWFTAKIRAQVLMPTLLSI